MSTPEHVICIPCGRKHGRFDPTSVTVGTFWPARCDFCGELTSVTSTADYGYPKPPEKHLATDLLYD